MKVPASRGRFLEYVNLDNAASTPPLARVVHSITALADWYASIHRGSGYKSKLATDAFEEARETVARFVGADSSKQAVIFVKHTTEAVNKVARQLQQQDDGLVLATYLEHHSNLLPWRHRTNMIALSPDRNNEVDLEQLEHALESNNGMVRLVAITGASNVTGYMPPIHSIASIAHRHAAKIFVDAAQLAPHHPIDIRPPEDPEHLDFVAFSGHKMYAPYGSGVLIGPRDFFSNGIPDQPGGGAITAVTDETTEWADLPDREEAGSPNVMGAVAMAVAIGWIEEFGLATLLEHERLLNQRLIEGLKTLPNVALLGWTSAEQAKERLGITTFLIKNMHHALAADALAWEWGIGVRSGCFCAHPLLLRLLQLSETEIESARLAMVGRQYGEIPGAIRASFAPYNTIGEVDLLIEAVAEVSSGNLNEDYVLNSATGDYEPQGGWPPRPSLTDLFSEPATV